MSKVYTFSASRFEGSLNVDLNEIIMNLVPFPRLHYLIPAMTPLYNVQGVGLLPRRLKERRKERKHIYFFLDWIKLFQMLFLEIVSCWRLTLNMECENNVTLMILYMPRYLACALMLRGKASISDVRKNIERQVEVQCMI